MISAAGNVKPGRARSISLTKFLSSNGSTSLGGCPMTLMSLDIEDRWDEAWSGWSTKRMVFAHKCVTFWLTAWRITPRRTFSGTYLSSLDGSGFSVTLLTLPVGSDGDNILRLLDAPTESVNWPPSISDLVRLEADDSEPNHQNVYAENEQHTLRQQPITCKLAFIQYIWFCLKVNKLSDDYTLFHDIIKSIHSSLVSAEPEIARFDTYLGDGDCGATLLAGSSSLVDAFTTNVGPRLPTPDPIADMQCLIDILGTQMGGTSSAIYSIFFSGFVSGIQKQFKS